MNPLILYSSRGNSAKKVAEEVKYNLAVSSDIICLNNQKVKAEDLNFDFLILVCPTYGDEELETEMLKTVESLSTKETFNSEVINLFERYLSVRLESFEEQLSKLETIE